MKEYTLTMTISVHFKADNQEQAEQIMENMDVKFEHPETLQPMENDILDWELKEAR